MAPRNKEQKTAAAGSINDLKEGDFLDPDLGLDPDLTASAGPAAGVDPAAGADAAAGVDPAAGADAAAGVDPATSAGPAAGVDPAAGADAAAGVDPAAGADAAAGVDPAAGDGPAAGSDTAGYIAVVVTGATLKFNGEQYAHSQTVKLPLKTAKRLMAIGLVKPLSVVRQELEAKARVGLSITADAGGVEFITGG